MQSGNELGDDGAKALVPALSEMKMLHSLNLRSNGIDVCGKEDSWNKF